MDRVEINCLCAVAAVCVVIACAGRDSSLPYVAIALVLAKLAMDEHAPPVRHRSAAARRAMFADGVDDAVATANDSGEGDAQVEESADEPTPSVLDGPSRVADPFKMYTIEEQERRRVDFNFRAPPALRQTSDQRARTLNTMYKELLETSKRGDPYLRPKGATDGCRPMRTT